MCGATTPASRTTAPCHATPRRDDGHFKYVDAAALADAMAARERASDDPDEWRRRSRALENARARGRERGRALAATLEFERDRAIDGRFGGYRFAVTARGGSDVPRHR